MPSTRLVLTSTALLALAAPSALARAPFPDKTDDQFQQECLAAMNTYRAKHHAPAFTLDAESVSYAKSRANLISQSEGLSYGHAGLKGHGEDLYWSGSSANTLNSCQSAIDSWYNEVKQYDYNNPGFSSATGHFTQMVWESSTLVGCARVGGKGSQWYETYVVCEFKAPGNVVGQFPQNVHQP